MPHQPPIRRMRENPDLDQLKRQAKELLHDYSAGKPEALAEVRAHYNPPVPDDFALHHAQLVLARAYGFESWPKLKAYVDGVTIRRLGEAVRAKDIPLVRYMLETRPELANMAMSYGDEHRPLHFAVMVRSAELVRMLMRAGANARAGIHPYRDATTAYVLAHDRGYDEIVAIIEEEEASRSASPTSDATAPPPSDPARAAVASGDLEWLRARHAAGALTNPITYDDGGLLAVAVKNNQFEALALLLGFGFDPNERASYGEGDWVSYSQGFPLWHAAALGRLDMAQILLDHGADPNVHIDSAGSSVYSAYSHRQWTVAELLESRGGIVTPDIAAIYRKTDLVRQMLAEYDRGTLAPAAIPSDKTLEEELLYFGTDAGSPEIVGMVLARIDWPREDPRWIRYLTNSFTFWHHIPWLGSGIKEFDRHGYLDVFRLVLARCGPNPPGGFAGRTPLHGVAAMGSWITDEEAAAFARDLLEAGARTDVRDSILQSTPLGWACRWGRMEVVKLLLAHGADPVEREAEPWATPLAWARKRGHAEIAALLEDRASIR